MNIPLITENQVNQINTSLLAVKKLLDSLEKDLKKQDERLKKLEEQNG